jgi:hypothetical protein
MSANPSVRNTAGTRSTVNRLDSTVPQGQASPIQCPACGAPSNRPSLENFHSASLYECPKCDLHFWHPAAMPDQKWHELAYESRDETALPLGPGHRFSLSDPKAPKEGRLLDLGCEVGNFLAAAPDIGFDVTGVELNQSAVRFARENYGLREVF